MEKYYVFALRLDSGKECVIMFEKIFSSVSPALNCYYRLAGCYSSSLSNCFVTNCDSDDSLYLKKIRLSSCKTSYYVYLQILS